MEKIKDYLCTGDNAVDITLKIIGHLELPIPEVYQESEYITQLAVKVQEEEARLL